MSTMLQPQEQSTSGAGASARASTTLDALPYLDVAHPDYLKYARSLIDHEMQIQQQPEVAQSKRRSHQQLDSIKSVPPVKYRGVAMKEAFDRIAEASDGSRSIHPASVANKEDYDVELTESSNNVNEWKRAVKKARIAFESERIRGVQLEVDKGEGAGGGTDSNSNSATAASDVWKRYIAQLEPQRQVLQQRLDEKRQAVEQINFARQQHQQEQVGVTLQSKMTQYHELVQKQVELRRAIAALEAEMA